jgi:3-mercaptopropionate dioxygenase
MEMCRGVYFFYHPSSTVHLINIAVSVRGYRLSCQSDISMTGPQMPDGDQFKLARLQEFVTGFTRLIDSAPAEDRIFVDGRALLQELVAHDDWLPDQFATPDPQYYQQYLLHCDPLQRFSVVSFVWGPGQRTPIHDHRVWGLIGVLRGQEFERRFERAGDGALREISSGLLGAGEVDAVSPRVGDIHQVSNALSDRPSISIHVYGGNIGRVRRAVFDPATGGEKPFISGYSSRVLPNLWENFQGWE